MNALAVPTRRPSLAGYTLRFVTGFAAVVIAAVIVWPLLPSRYEAPASIVLLVSSRDDDPAAAVKPMRQNPDENATQSDIDLISSPELSETVLVANKLMDDPEFNGSSDLRHRLTAIPLLGWLLPTPPVDSQRAVRDRLMKRLQVDRDRRSYTVTFGYWSSDPAKAAALTKSLLDAYVALQLSRKRNAIARVTNWLDDRVSRLRAQAATADARVKDLMESSGLMDKGAETSLQSQLTTLSSEYAIANARVIDDSVRADVLRSMQAQGTLDDAPEVLASPAIQKLKDARASLASRPGVLLSESREVSRQISVESDHIVAAIGAQEGVDRRRMTLLGQALAGVRDAIKGRAEAQLQLEVLQRDSKASHSVLEDSLTRLNGQTSLALSITPDVEVMAEPDPPLQATFPNLLFASLGTFILATMCGVALALRFHVANGFSLPRWRAVSPTAGPDETFAFGSGGIAQRARSGASP